MKFSAFFPLPFLITCTSGRPGILAIRNVAGVVTPTPSSVSSPESTSSSPPHVHHAHHVHGPNYRRVPRRWVVNRPDHRVVRPPSLNKRLAPTRTTGPYPEDLETEGPGSSLRLLQESQPELATNKTISSLGRWSQTTPFDQNIPQFSQRTNEKNRAGWSGNGAFTITQVRNPNFNEDDDSRNGLFAMMHAYAKYGTNMTSAIRLAMRLNPAFQRLTKRGNITATVPAYPQKNDFEYLSPIQIGTPPQTLNVAIDTGSADFWVMTSETLPHQLQGHTTYLPFRSNTSSLLLNHTWSITYGDGSSASGSVYTDRVSLGFGNSSSSRAAVVVSNQTVESARLVSPAFTYDASCSGILGLALSGNSVKPVRARTFLENLQEQKILPRAVFTADLQSRAPGRYSFGFIDEKAYTGEMGFVSVSPRGSPWWRFMAGGFQVGNDEQTGTGRVDMAWPAIADTGTSLLLAPVTVVTEYYAKVNGSAFDPEWAGMVFPCGTKLPDWSFFLGEYRGTVPGRYFSYSKINETHCYGGMQSSEDIGFGVFGDVVLKAQFVVFDLEEKRLGFANKVLGESVGFNGIP